MSLWLVNKYFNTNKVVTWVSWSNAETFYSLADGKTNCGSRGDQCWIQDCKLQLFDVLVKGEPQTEELADTLESSSSNKHLEGLTYSWLPVNNPWLLSNCFWRSSLRYGEAKKKLYNRMLDNILRNQDHLRVNMNNELGSGLQRLSVSTSTCKHESTRPKEHFTLLCLLPSISQRFLLINAPIICLLQLSFTFFVAVLSVDISGPCQ